MKQLFYYAYGSNLLTRRLENRIGHAPYVRNHILQNYKLVFNCGGFANIEPERGSQVNGALYAINAAQLKELNFYEGFYVMEFFDIPEGLAVVFTGMRHIVEKSVARGEKSTFEYTGIILEGMIEKGMIDEHDALIDIRLDICKPQFIPKKLRKKLRRR